MTTIDIPDFTLGTPKQIRAATSLREDYLSRLFDRGFPLEQIVKLSTVRCVAKWWLDNKSRLEVMEAEKHFKAVDKLITQHGSAEDAAEAQIDIAYKREKQSSEYYYLHTPMFKL